MCAHVSVSVCVPVSMCVCVSMRIPMTQNGCRGQCPCPCMCVSVSVCVPVFMCVCKYEDFYDREWVWRAVSVSTYVCVHVSVSMCVRVRVCGSMRIPVLENGCGGQRTTFRSHSLPLILLRRSLLFLLCIPGI